jgi:hypothetical protein
VPPSSGSESKPIKQTDHAAPQRREPQMYYYLLDVCLRFGIKYCHHLQDLKVSRSSKQTMLRHSAESLEYQTKLQFLSEEANPAINKLYLEMCIGVRIQSSCHTAICFGQWDEMGRRIRV